MRARYLLLGVLLSGCFGKGCVCYDTANVGDGCGKFDLGLDADIPAPTSDAGRASVCPYSTPPQALFLLRGSDAVIGIRGIAQGTRGIVVSNNPRRTQPGDPPVVSAPGSIDADCSMTYLTVHAGVEGTAAIQFDDGTVQSIVVQAADRLTVTPKFDSYVAGLSPDQRLTKDSPPDDFGKTAHIAKGGVVRVQVHAFAGSTELEGRAVATFKNDPLVTVSMFDAVDVRRSLVDITANAEGTSDVTFSLDGQTTTLPVQVVPMTDVTKVALYAQREDSENPRSTYILARALNAEGDIVYGAPFVHTVESTKVAEGDLLSYVSAKDAPPKVLTVRSGDAFDVVTIHPFASSPFDADDSNDAAMNCSFQGKSKTFFGITVGPVALATLALLRRRARRLPPAT